MAGLFMCGRRWSIATDDFLLIGIIQCVFFLTMFCWLVLVCIANVYKGCFCGNNVLCSLVDIFLCASCGLSAVNFILGVLFICFSTRGTISQPHPRRHVVTLLYIKIVISIFDLLWAIFGSVLLSYSSICHEFIAELNMEIITGCLWFEIAARIFAVLIFYDTQGKKKVRKTIESEYFTRPIAVKAVRKWKCRFRALFFWCTAPSTEKNDALHTFSELLAYLTHDLDLVTTDFLAGLLLYRHKCHEKYKIEKDEIASSPAVALPDGTSIDHFPYMDMPQWMNLQLAHRYFHVGMGVFGWAWAIYRNLSCGLCMICKKMTCCFCCRSQSQNVIGDNCCGCNLAGFQVSTDVIYSDIVHVSFVNGVYEVPFFVLIDSSTSSIVLTARGSMSFADALTDCAAGFAPMDVPECPPNTLCHSGVLKAAKRIVEKLESKKILESAFKEREDYSLVTTGHSLGAGVAAVLTVLLRGSYPNIRCFAFAPPPVFSRAGLLSTQGCVFTVIFGNDSVPFLSVNNIQNFVKEVVTCLEHCNLPKHKVLLGHYKLNSTNDSKNDGGNETSLMANGSDAQGNEKSTYAKPEEIVNGASDHSDLFLPGRILHIRYSKNGYRLRISAAEDFKPLVFRPKMVLHHFPQFMENCLKQLGENVPLQATSQ